MLLKHTRIMCAGNGFDWTIKAGYMFYEYFLYTLIQIEAPGSLLILLPTNRNDWGILIGQRGIKFAFVKETDNSYSSCNEQYTQ